MKVWVRRVANAGIAQVKALLDLTEDDFERMFRINVFGVNNCYKAAAKQMIAQGNGKQNNPCKPAPSLSHQRLSHLMKPTP